MNHPPQFREFIVRHEALAEKDQAYSLINPFPAKFNRKLFQEINSYIRWLVSFPPHRELKPAVEFNLKALEYLVGHMINMTIFCADCKLKKVDLVMLDDNAMYKLAALFPKANSILHGFSGVQDIPPGSPEWFLIDSLRRGTGEYFINILKKNKIPRYGVDDFARLVHHNIPFYMFRPPFSVMKETLSKIEKSNEITYYQMYARACDVLGIQDRVISPHQIREVAEKLYQANAILQKKAGFQV